MNFAYQKRKRKQAQNSLINLYQRDTSYQKLDHFNSIWAHSTFLEIANISKLKYSFSQKMLN